nr:GtrA family protein [Coralloluteibacterium stylophorae]
MLRQGGSYIAVGGLQFAIDWVLFVALTALGVQAPAANLASRTAGAAVGFWLNGRITFAKGGKPRLGRRRLARFLAMWLVLTAASTLLVGWTAHQVGLRHAWLAKPLVEALMAVLGFACSRTWVYR